MQPNEYTPSYFFMSSKHYSSLSQRAWLLSPAGSYDTILTQEMVYNKKRCVSYKETEKHHFKKKQNTWNS